MSALGRSALSLQARSGAARSFAASIQYGRTPTYRRLEQTYSSLALSRNSAVIKLSPESVSLSGIATLRSSFLPSTIHLGSSRTNRLFSSYSPLAAKVGKPPGSESYREAPQAKQPEPEPQPAADEPSKASSAEGASRPEAEDAKQEQDHERKQESGEEGEQGERKEEGKKQEAPPPPHGDKSPWQVFTETLQAEFKASKEWNDSTKQLGGRIDDFRQNETIKKAREGYTTVTGAAASTTGKVFKTTGKAIGQTAAWTWDTLPVKGLRATARVTGSGLEKLTRPIRQTEAYKSVANVIDDGSSSKYGGWTEKEERRLKREAREEEEIRKGLRPRRSEPMEEDPKYACTRG